MASLQLVFPPLTGVNYPYLSTPSLMAYVLENFEPSGKPDRPEYGRGGLAAATANRRPVD